MKMLVAGVEEVQNAIRQINDCTDTYVVTIETNCTSVEMGSVLVSSMTAL